MIEIKESKLNELIISKIEFKLDAEDINNLVNGKYGASKEFDLDLKIEGIKFIINSEITENHIAIDDQIFDIEGNEIHVIKDDGETLQCLYDDLFYKLIKRCEIIDI